MYKVNLVEPGVKSFLNHSLNNCKNNKYKYYNSIFNISAFIIFLVLFVGLLFYKYKGKLSPLEKEEKIRKQKYYIFSKIKQYEQINNNQSMITNLPKWNKI